MEKRAFLKSVNMFLRQKHFCNTNIFLQDLDVLEDIIFLQKQKFSKKDCPKEIQMDNQDQEREWGEVVNRVR